MTEPLDQPNWESLPDRPDLFFGLSKGFDRRDLKRAYNGLIRRFKPESCPEEFKRIRAAFEELEARLRAKEVIRERQQEFPEWEGDVFDPGEIAEIFSPAEPTPPAFPTLERLTVESIENVAAALAACADKGPREWCHLALIRDELDPDEPLVLFDTLLDGLRSVGIAPPLMGLLHAACQEPLEPEDSIELLKRLERLVLDDDPRFGVNFYYFMSRPIWSGLSAKIPFDEFAEMLAGTRARLGDGTTDDYLGLLIELMPRLSFRADEPWLREASAFIEEHYHELPPWVQYEVVQFDWVAAYRDGREEFLNGEPAREKIDAVLELISNGKGQEAVRKLSELLAWIRAKPQRALDAFPVTQGKSLSHALDPLWWFGEEHAADLGGLREHAKPDQVYFEVKGFAWLLEKSTDKSFLGIAWNLCALIWLAVYLGIVGLLPLVVIVYSLTDAPAAAGLLALGWVGLIAYCWASGMRVRRWFDYPASRLGIRFANSLYARRWRHEVMLSLGRTRFTLDEYRVNLSSIDEEGITNQHFLAELLEFDDGLALYSLALQFEDVG